MADLQPGSLPTTFTAGADTDYLPVSRGAQTGRMLRSELLGDVPRLFNTLPENGTAWTLAQDTHSNRLVIATNANPITITFNTAGMTLNDGGRIEHGGAGQATITGATFSYSPGVSATPTIPAGVGGWLDWRFDGAGIKISQKSEDATGGGGAMTAYSDHSLAIAPNDTVENTLATIAIPSLPAGAMIRITHDWTIGTQGFQCFLRVYYGGQQAWLYNLAAADTTSVAMDAVVRIKATGAATQRVLPTLNSFAGTSLNPATALTVNGAVSQNITVTCEKVVTGRTVELTSLTVEVITP